MPSSQTAGDTRTNCGHVWTTDGVIKHCWTSAPLVWHEGGGGRHTFGAKKSGTRRAAGSGPLPGGEAAVLGRSVVSKSLRPH